MVLGACARLVPHPWNFTPMMAIGLFAGSHARKASTGVLATLFALVLSDAVLGFYPGFWYVYAAALIPVLLGRLIRNRSGAGAIAAAAIASSLSFFLITNFMVWATRRDCTRTRWLDYQPVIWLAYPSIGIKCWATPSTPSQYSAATRISTACANPSGRPHSMRIVSLLASATEIVCALGAGEMLVGRSHECDNPDWVRRLPACSDPAFDVSVSSGEIDAEVRRRLRSGEPLYHIHGELIRELRADLLITQSHCEVCAVTPGDVERSGACATRRAATGALRLVFGGNLPGYSADRASAWPGGAGRGRGRVANVSAWTRSGKKLRVSVGQPWSCWSGRIRYSRWETGVQSWWKSRTANSCLGKKGEYSAAIPAEQLRDADPEYLIVAPCGFNLERSLREQGVLERYPWWRELQAVRNGNVAFADGNLLLQSFRNDGLPNCRDHRRNPPRRFFRRKNRRSKLAARRIAGGASPRLMRAYPLDHATDKQPF